MAVAWLEQTAAEVPADDAWLGQREREVLRGLRLAKRRRDWRLGRWTAKRAIAATLGLDDVREIEILAAASGAPEAWIAGDRAALALSISHSAGHGLCCVAREEIALGCDLESIEARSRAFASDYLTSEELCALDSLLPASVSHPYLPEAGRHGAPSGLDQNVAINLYWSAKESALKALGEGLRLDTRSVYVETDAREGPCAPSWRELRVTHESGRIFQGWWQSGGGFVRTIVASRAVRPTSAPGGQTLRQSGQVVGHHP